MIARLFVLLPFSLIIPKGETFEICGYEEGNYRINIFPPQESTKLPEEFKYDEVLINGVPGFQANALRIDFEKETFNRAKDSSVCDPPYSLIRSVINSFLIQLRYVTRSSLIKPINFPEATWHIQYLNDDDSELPEEEGFARGRGVTKVQFSLIALNKEIWDDINKLSPYSVPPQWDSLLLDADSVLPEIGPAIVLAFTALEVFISYLLNELAKDTSIPFDLWEWINNRQFWLKEPDTSEQFDALLKILLGTSLKENNNLWESFKNLKDARNSFVHQGVASVGKKPITEVEARQFVMKANEIIKYIKDKLPKKLHWLEFKHSLTMEATKKFE